MLKPCKTCNELFEASEKELKRGNAKFCSQKCFGQSRRGKIKKENNCFCSKCATPFYRSPSKKLNSKNGLYFCNRLCKEEAQKLGGIKEIMPPHYGTSEKINYRELFDVSELVCFRCSYREFTSCVDIHHIDKDRNNNKKENLIPLCTCCHRSLHLGLWKLGD